VKILLTMAGFGNRFKDAGYRQEKFEIEFRGHKLLDWSLASLGNFQEFDLILIARDLPGIRKSLAESARAIGFQNARIVTVVNPTRGQAETATLAEPAFDQDDSILIFNTDTFIDPTVLSPADIRGDGWIPTFSASGDQWSFVETGDGGRALRTAEKTRISDQCSVGLYYFSSFQGFCDLVRNARWERELFVAPLYNEWIAAGHTTFVYELPESAVTVLGTPQDLERASSLNRPTWPG
jgi:dTDP-glucose pyrophosphorylase